MLIKLSGGPFDGQEQEVTSTMLSLYRSVPDQIVDLDSNPCGFSMSKLAKYIRKDRRDSIFIFEKLVNGDPI